MERKSISERLKQIMQERDLNQIDILNACQPLCGSYGIKIGKNDLSQYVSGKVQPGYKKLAILCEALNVNEVWMLGYDVSPEYGARFLEDRTEEEGDASDDSVRFFDYLESLGYYVFESPNSAKWCVKIKTTGRIVYLDSDEMDKIEAITKENIDLRITSFLHDGWHNS